MGVYLYNTIKKENQSSEKHGEMRVRIAHRHRGESVPRFSMFFTGLFYRKFSNCKILNFCESYHFRLDRLIKTEAFHQLFKIYRFIKDTILEKHIFISPPYINTWLNINKENIPVDVIVTPFCLLSINAFIPL